MEKDNFFDTNVIFNYCKFTKNTKLEIIKKCYEYIKNKKGKFIICYFLEQELKNIVKKNKIIHKEIVEKVKDRNYKIGISTESSFLKPKDIAYATKTYELKKHISIEILANAFLEEETNLDIKIEVFFEKMVDEKVVPINQIDKNLVNKIYEIIPNHADCKILASALQLQEEMNIFLFVTADGQDLDPNGYEFLKEHFEINYAKDKYKFPELLNLMFTN